MQISNSGGRAQLAGRAQIGEKETPRLDVSAAKCGASGRDSQSIELVWRRPGQNERCVRVVDAELLATALWLREKRFVGQVPRLRGRRVAAVSVRKPQGPREAQGRIWYLRPTDSFDAPVPVEAVITQSIGKNRQSVPAYLLTIIGEIQQAIKSSEGSY
jgi:hypothetical protein